MKHSTSTVSAATLGVLAALLPACGSSDPAVPQVQVASALGDPIPGLTPAELAAFNRGRKVFERRFTPSEGLGPMYNATSCASCHSTPEIGGTANLYRNFYIAKWNFGGPQGGGNLPGLPSAVVPAFGSSNPLSPFTLEEGRFPIPDSISGAPVVSAQRNSIPIFGTGMFEFISDATILSRADPEDDDGDGISGRWNGEPLGIGRFGQKAQSNNIEVFTRTPLFTQMGITSDPFLGSAGGISAGASAMLQATIDPDVSTVDQDGVPDPEISTDDLGDLIAFTRFLAPPQKKPFDDAATRGEVLFDQIGCTDCHVPSLPSSRGPVEAYTDLLIHDMGPALADGITFGVPQVSPSMDVKNGNEFRTQPLWGVSMFPPHLHDGRAATIEEAILLHGGEGQASRDAYAALPSADQQDVLAFLNHL